ncbi:hypothetical protein BaRGS_00008089 [Batillaria attramentaria]|uniref:Uncharacterized protein n=1 Tax=Batillaria attramentaria TaxID=370345 RepID=A0ABD0LNC4_9CAEN
MGKTEFLAYESFIHANASTMSTGTSGTRESALSRPSPTRLAVFSPSAGALRSCLGSGSCFQMPYLAQGTHYMFRLRPRKPRERNCGWSVNHQED